MANREEMDFTYTLIDKIFRLSIGETGDFSCAMYNGDFSMSLEQAQRRKHEFLAEQLRITKGSRVVDLGCGWGPFLGFLKTLTAEGTGVTLSAGQAEACRKSGFNVHVMDCRHITPETFGKFDAVTSLGAFEHFCSLEECNNGKQDAIYSNFFKTVSDLLPSGGRFYLQTMAFSKNMIDPKTIDIHAQRNSAAYAMAVMLKQFPGSWLPYGDEQIIRNAKPFFRVVFKNSGRLDYIETIKQWGKRYRQFDAKKYLFYLSLIPRYVTSKELRERLSKDQLRVNILCFENEIFDHYRIVFEKIL